MNDILTQSDTKELIDAFYKKVVADPVIGTFFTDVIELSWDEHIPIMNNFWNSILLGTGTYHRNPMIKHIELDRKKQLEEKHFQRWLSLWEETVRETYAGATAEEAISRAKNIAVLMHHKVRSSRGNAML